MTKLKVLYVFSLFLLLSCATSKVYVPETTPLSPRTGFLNGEEVDVVIYDGRLDKEASSELVMRISDDFRNSFPSAKIKLLPESDYYKESLPGRITIKVGISSYTAAFGSRVSLSVGSFGGTFFYGIMPEGVWNGVTGFSVNLFDKRNNQNTKSSQNIGKVVSMSNLMGYSTAKQALFQSYAVVMNETANFIENSLMK